MQDGAVRGEVLEEGGVAGAEHGPAEEVAALERHAFCAVCVAREVDVGWARGAVEIREPDARDGQHGARVPGDQAVAEAIGGSCGRHWG